MAYLRAGAASLKRTLSLSGRVGGMARDELQDWLAGFLTDDGFDRDLAEFFDAQPEVRDAVEALRAAGLDDADALTQFRADLADLGAGQMADGLVAMLRLAETRNDLRTMLGGYGVPGTVTEAVTDQVADNIAGQSSGAERNAATLHLGPVDRTALDGALSVQDVDYLGRVLASRGLASDDADAYQALVTEYVRAGAADPAHPLDDATLAALERGDPSTVRALVERGIAVKIEENAQLIDDELRRQVAEWPNRASQNISDEQYWRAATAIERHMPGLNDQDIDRAMHLLFDNHNNQFQFHELEQAFIIERTYGITLGRVGRSSDPVTGQPSRGGGDFRDVRPNGLRFELLSSPGANVNIETSDKADAIDELLDNMDDHISRPRINLLIIDIRELSEHNMNLVFRKVRQWPAQYRRMVRFIDQNGNIVEL